MKQFGNLVRLLDMDPEFIIDLKYSTPDNFTGSVVYDFTECYIDIHTAQQLIAAKELAKKDGYLIKVWDAYRPVSAQQRFWEVCPNPDFVGYPPDMDTVTEFNNCHLNGQAVDITLTDLNGNEILMPSGFDDFSDRARLDCPDTPAEALKNGLYLRKIMTACGFTPDPVEWWHFNDTGAEPVRYSNLPCHE